MTSTRAQSAKSEAGYVGVEDMHVVDPSNPCLLRIAPGEGHSSPSSVRLCSEWVDIYSFIATSLEGIELADGDGATVAEVMSPAQAAAEQRRTGVGVGKMTPPTDGDATRAD